MELKPKISPCNNYSHTFPLLYSEKQNQHLSLTCPNLYSFIILILVVYTIKAMEETEESNGNQKCNTKIIRGRTRTNNPPQKHHHPHHHHQLIQYSNQNGFFNQNQYYQRYYYPALLPLPPLIPLPLAFTPPLPQNHSFRTKTHLQKPSCKLNKPPFAASSETQVPKVSISPGICQSSQLFAYICLICMYVISN